MSTVDRPTYCDWEIGWWFTSSVRFGLPKAAQMTYCEICWKLWQDGGSTPRDVQFLARLTMDTPEVIESILKMPQFYTRPDGTFGHRVVDKKLAEQRGRRRRASKGGKAKAEALSHNEGASSSATSSASGPAIECVSECVSDKSDLPPSPKPQPAPPRPSCPPPGQVKPGFASETRRSNPPVKSQSTLNPQRIAQLLDGCVPKDNHDRHQHRPWLSKMMGDWIDRQTSDDAFAFRMAYTERFGYSLDLGPGAEVGGAA